MDVALVASAALLIGARAALLPQVAGVFKPRRSLVYRFLGVDRGNVQKQTDLLRGIDVALKQIRMDGATARKIIAEWDRLEQQQRQTQRQRDIEGIVRCMRGLTDGEVRRIVRAVERSRRTA